MTKKWVIPDLHGHSGTLKALIEEQVKPAKSDQIFFLGDYIDRGPNSKGVIDYIISLKKGGYHIRTLRGNHEDYLLRIYENETTQKNILGLPHHSKLKKEWFKYGGKETLKSFNVSRVNDIPDKYINWINQLEYYIELDSFILVHAGFNFLIEDPFSDKHSMMWIKDFKADMEKTGSRKIIHGHVPVSLSFIELLRSGGNFDFIDLDNGIYMKDTEGFGNLVALEINSMEMKVQVNVDIP